MSNPENVPAAVRPASEEPEGVVEAPLGDLAAPDEDAAQVKGGHHHPLGTNWNLVRNPNGG